MEAFSDVIFSGGCFDVFCPKGAYGDSEGCPEAPWNPNRKIISAPRGRKEFGITKRRETRFRAPTLGRVNGRRRLPG